MVKTQSEAHHENQTDTPWPYTAHKQNRPRKQRTSQHQNRGGWPSRSTCIRKKDDTTVHTCESLVGNMRPGSRKAWTAYLFGRTAQHREDAEAHGRDGQRRAPAIVQYIQANCGNRNVEARGWRNKKGTRTHRSVLDSQRTQRGYNAAEEHHQDAPPGTRLSPSGNPLNKKRAQPDVLCPLV